MKFVYFGYDFSLGIVQRLIQEGHDCLGFVTFECDNIFNFNTALQAFAAQNNIPVSFDKPSPAMIDDFIAKGAQVFFTSGYPHKIPPIDESKAWGINFHPSLLPQGRGIMPTPHILLHAPQASGVTVHKIVEQIDAGDILYQESLPLNEREDVETLSARITLCGPDILSMVFSDFEGYWQRAKRQDFSKATTWPEPSEDMRTLDWNKGVDDIERTARAFGRYGSLAHFSGKKWVVFSLAGWKEAHTYEPGVVAAVLAREIVIAAHNGFICLKEFQEIEA